MKSKILLLAITTSLVLTGCGNKITQIFNKTASENSSGEEQDIKEYYLGNLGFEYDANKMNIEESKLFRTGNNTVELTDATIDLNADRPNDELFSYPIIFLNIFEDATNNMEIKSSEDISNIKIFSQIPTDEIEEVGDYFHINIKVINKAADQSYLLASDYTYIIPSSNSEDNNIYLVTLLDGNKIDSNGMSGTKYEVFEYGYNIIKEAVNSMVGKPVLKEYETINDELNGYLNSLSNLKGDSDLSSSNTGEEAIRVIGKNGDDLSVDTNTFIESLNEDYVDTDPQYIGDDTYDINDHYQGVDMSNTVKISQEDMVGKGKSCYIVGEDIEPGQYYIVNNLEAKYNSDGTVSTSSVHPGTMSIYPSADDVVNSGYSVSTIADDSITEITDEGISEITDGEIADEASDNTEVAEEIQPTYIDTGSDQYVVYEVSQDDPFATESDKIIELIDGQAIVVNGLDLSLAKF